MKNKSIGILLLFIAFIMLLSCSVNAANVLIISEGDTVHGETVANMLSKIAPDSFTVEQKSIANNMSLAQTIAEINTNGKTYDSVIVQLPYGNSTSNDAVVTDCVSAINSLHAKNGNNANTQYFFGTPVGKIANYDQEVKVSDEVVKKVISGLTTVKVSSIPVFENIKIATDKSLEVCANNKLTTLGDLLVACTYSNSLGKEITALTSYENLVDADVKEIISISNATASAVKDTPTQNTITEENTENVADNAEIDGVEAGNVNREPIVEIDGSSSKELVIRVYDKEQAGIKASSLALDDLNGEKIERENEEETIFKINQEKYLNSQEYKQFYIYAEDNDGCILKEYFRVKYIQNAENGSYYKINRAPRIRPELKLKNKGTDGEANIISLHVMDQTGIQAVTPKTVEENGLQAVNLYADGNYDGYSGIEGSYDWQDVNGKTVTGSNTYIKEANTKEQNIEEFFKYKENTENVSLVLEEDKYRFNAHAVDATGLAADRIMIVDFSEKAEEKGDIAGNGEEENEKSSTTPEEKGTLKDRNGSHAGYDYKAFKADCEPRLKYIPKDDYLYIEIRDCVGIACEYPSEYENKKNESDISKQPQIYYYKNDKRGDIVPNLKRPTAAEYKKEGVEYVYTIGLPIEEIGEEYTKFELLAYDAPSTTKLKSQTFIDEVFMAKKSSTGKIIVNRAPVVHVVGLVADFKQMALHAIDWGGVSTVKLESISKTKGQASDTIRSYNGTVQSDWGSVAYCTKNKKYVADALTKFEKIDTVFNRQNWTGITPRIADADGVFQIMISAVDNLGATSTKIMVMDIKRWVEGELGGETGNATSKPVASDSNSAKSSSPNKSSKNSSPNKSQKSGDSKQSPGDGGSSKSGGSGSSSGSSKSGDSSGSGSSSGSSGSGSSDGSSSSTSSNVLEKGSKGDLVKKLQTKLKELGWTDLDDYGTFGSKTKKAVKEFQKLNGLDPDGRVGDKTWNKLISNDAVGKNSKSQGSSNKDTVEANPNKKPEKKKDSDEGINKKKAIVDRKVFYMKIKSGRDGYYRILDGLATKSIPEHPSEVWASQPYADYDVEYGPGLKQASKPTLDSRGTTLTITAKNSGSGGEKVSDVYTAFDSYVTITGYYKKGNTVYKDTCRYHYIMADAKWWAHPEYIQNLSTNIGGK